jgi:hypothetical protein
MANALITPSIIAREALFQLENNCIMANLVHRQYKKEFVKVGESISIRKPVQFLVSDGATLDLQDVKESSTPFTVDQRKHVAWQFSSQDLTMTIEDYSERYIKPAMIGLANQVDTYLCQVGAEQFFHRVGTPGTAPDEFSDLADVAQRMDEAAIPDDGSRRLVLNPKGRWALANGLGGTGSGGIYNADIVHSMVRRGHLGQIANFDIFGTQNIRRHTTGTYSGTPLVNDASFTDNTNVVAFDGMTGSVTDAIKAGDVFTLAGVNAVNPISKEDLGYLQQFVALTDVDTTSGAGNITVYPTINAGTATGFEAYQNVTAVPADNAAITIVGTAATAYTQNLAFHKNALALVTCPLEMPDSASFKARATWRGLSIRVIKDYDITNDREIIRLDIFYGAKAIYPELGVRVDG